MFNVGFFVCFLRRMQAEVFNLLGLFKKCAVVFQLVWLELSKHVQNMLT